MEIKSKLQCLSLCTEPQPMQKNINTETGYAHHQHQAHFKLASCISNEEQASRTNLDGSDLLLSKNLSSFLERWKVIEQYTVVIQSTAQDWLILSIWHPTQCKNSMLICVSASYFDFPAQTFTVPSNEQDCRYRSQNNSDKTPDVWSELLRLAL